MKEKLQQSEEDSNDEIVGAQDRIQELEEQQKRHIQELQKIREDREQSTFGRSQNLQRAESRIAELEHQQLEQR